MEKDRLAELLNNFIEYTVELKGNEPIEDKEIFIKDIIGFTDEEVKYFGLDIDFLEEN